MKFWMLKTATIVGRGLNWICLQVAFLAHFLKTFFRHFVLLFVFSFSLLCFNSSIYSSSTISKRDAIVKKKQLLDFHEVIGSLSKDDGNGKDNARKQWSDWLNEENNRAARAARTLAEFFDVACQMTTWNFQI